MKRESLFDSDDARKPCGKSGPAGKDAPDPTRAKRLAPSARKPETPHEPARRDAASGDAGSRGASQRDVGNDDHLHARFDSTPTHDFTVDQAIPEPAARDEAAGRIWTPEQQAGIRTTGKSLLVSAAAGSGKTSVLAERCAHLVCDANPACDIDDLLVVTFTESAAGEMKRKIRASLESRLAREPSNQRVQRQVETADRAQVSTLHAFCARLLRQHFNCVGLDPGFLVMDGDDAILLRREVARRLFDSAYESQEAAGPFLELIDAYGEGNDERVLDSVLHVHDLLTSVLDRAGWVGACRERLEEAAREPLHESALGQRLLELVGRGLGALRQRCASHVNQLGQMGFAQYAGYLAEIRSVLAHWEEVFREHGIDALAEVSHEPPWPTLPKVPNSVPNKDLAKSLVDSIRDETKDGPWRDLLRFSTSQWHEGLERIAPHAQVFLSLAEQFTIAYDKAKGETRMLDFADLERFTLHALCDGDPRDLRPSDCAKAYHRQFAHVLVDEFQDINEVQDAILTLVSRECLAHKSRSRPRMHLPHNLFCVGDVKQSIYRFRLAEPGRFLDRQERYSDPESHGQVVHLRSNFRSRSSLLDAINCVFGRLMSKEAVDIDYDESHHLQGGADYPEPDDDRCFSGAPIELHLLPADARGSASDARGSVPDPRGSSPAEGAPGSGSDDCAEDGQDLDRLEREAALVAMQIRNMVGLEGAPARRITLKEADGSFTSRPAQLRDIVILLRSLKYTARQFADILRSAGIRVHLDAGSGFFEAMEVRDVLALLQTLDNRQQDLPLAAVLRGPLGQLAEPDSALARIRLAYPASAFHEAAARYASEKSDALALELQRLFARLDAWREAAQRRPLADVIESIYQESGYLAYIAGLHDGEARVANLRHLLERAAQFGKFQSRGLSRFLRFLEQLEEQLDIAQPSLATQAEDAVRIMSIHRAKGQEFPIVVIPDLGKRINLTDCQGAILADRHEGLGMMVVDHERRCRYPSLASMLVRDRLVQQTLAEELRVLYVALTRAKEHLLLVGTCDAKSAERWTTQWRGHIGPLPGDVVLGARTMLDWLGPVATAAASEPIEVFRTTWHTADAIRAWPIAPARRAMTPLQQSIARLKPLDPPPPTPASTARAITRVSFEYPHRAYTRLEATRAVTRYEADPLPAHATPAPPTSSPLARPRFLMAVSHSTAADRGVATHLVLEHLNFSAPCDAADVDRQIASMRERRILADGQDQLVHRDGIVWLMGSETGQLLRRGASDRTLHCELPVHFAIHPGSADPQTNQAAIQYPATADPLDRIMVRGRIDVLITGPEGAVLIDYKTDEVAPADVPARAEVYTPQLRAYCDAIQRITGHDLKAACLIFLKPKMAWRMP